MRQISSMLFVLCVAATPALCAEDNRIPLILDTDIGFAIDDGHALALVLASEEFDLLGVTTCTSQAEDRAWMVCRFLTSVGRNDVPVAFGREPQPKSEIDWQIQYRRHPAVVWNRTLKPAKEPAAALMFRLLKENHEQENPKATILAIGPLTNVARLLEQHPESTAWIHRIVMMGGALEIGYGGEPPAAAEWNIKSDIPAAKAVFASGVPLLIAPLDAAQGVELTDVQQERLFAAHTPITWELQSLSQLDEGEESNWLFDPIAVRLALDPKFCTTKKLCLHIDEEGKTRPVKGKANATVATKVDADEFVRWYIDTVSSAGKPVLPKDPGNQAKTVERRGLPRVVHAFEDYDNDIEKRWWMTGNLETDDVPEGSRRACRAVLTQDYDAKMGDTTARYKAVIFNPVPGPPMGPKTRLSFRYKLSGTDTIRVQLFSLSNGYHRYLSVNKLPQDEWSEATVDMTQMRRPDGSGGPLAEDERIDDIQFYVDPRADLIIDEMILYDEADEGEKRPFPKCLLFTGWFDTGKQGNEWPGDFEIVLHEKPRTWDAAKSIINADTNKPWIRIDMRGMRGLAGEVQLRFDYRLAAKENELTVVLVNSETGQRVSQKRADLKSKVWAEASIAFNPTVADKNFAEADEIHFLLPGDGELLIDDLLLYVP